MIQRWIIPAAGAFLWIASAFSSAGQVNDPNSGIQYSRGQNVVPSFEGWQPNTDGTYSFWFGYLNRNYEEEVNVPVGRDNSFSPGNQDQGQPAYFMARRNRFVFKVTVPKDWPRDKILTWTLTSHGQTMKALASLNVVWEINNGVITQNSGSGAYDPSNEQPVITGEKSASVTLPDTLTLSASVTDDGRPKPKPERAKKGAGEAKADDLTGIPSIIPEGFLRKPGLNVRWVLYRGPGPVDFDPPKDTPVYGKPITSTTKVGFSVPGNYWLRAIASDGALESFHDIQVTVKAAPGN